jgi:lipoprotein-releasing system permease protein
MNFPLFVARRYFLSKKKKNFINVISIISVIGAAIGTAALIIVLSVFNGLEGLLRNLYGSFDPEIKIEAVSGKSFVVDKIFLEKVRLVEGVGIITEVIEDNALIKYQDAQTIVKLKGVSPNYLEQNNMTSLVKTGKPQVLIKGMPFAVIGSGLQYALSVNIENEFFPVQFWYPRNQKTLVMNPETAFNKASIRAGGVFSLEREYDDNYVIAPVTFVAELMEYGNRRTALEIKPANGYSTQKLITRLQEKLGNQYKVLNRDQQHAGLFKAIKIEKLFGFITFTFIMGIACFNIFFTLTMLAIEKKKDIAMLYSMGASTSLVQKIFLFEGAIIAFTGAFAGLVIGTGICFLQQEFGLVSMGMQTSILDAYPVKVQWSDLVFTCLAIIVVTLLVSFGPSLRASRIDIKSNL